MKNIDEFKKQTSTNDFISKVIDGLNKGKEEYEDMRVERGLITSSSKGLSTWDFRFKHIYNNFINTKYMPIKLKKGPSWEFIVIYDKNINILYLVTREDNFKTLQKKDDIDKHYIKIFSAINGTCNYNMQLNIFNKQNMIELDSPIIGELQSLLGDFKEPIDCCKLILFREDISGITKITENIADYDLNIIYSANLSHLIVVSINQVTDTVSMDGEYTVAKDIELPIRQKKHKIHDLKSVDKKIDLKDLDMENKN